MAERAHVTSSEAIDQFRANLVVYLSKSKRLLEESCDEVYRLRNWLLNDQRILWENQVRRRRKALDEAEQALFSAGLSNLREPTAAERTAVQRARRSLAEAEEKLQRVKQWGREFENRVEPLVRQLESLRTLFANDMLKGLAYLSLVMQAIDAYAGVAAPIASGAVEPLEEAKKQGEEAAAEGDAKEA